MCIVGGGGVFVFTFVVFLFLSLVFIIITLIIVKLGIRTVIKTSPTHLNNIYFRNM